MQKIKLYTKCLRCGKPLTNYIARQRGYGNYCWLLHNIEIKQRTRNLFDNVEKLHKK